MLDNLVNYRIEINTNYTPLEFILLDSSILTEYSSKLDQGKGYFKQKVQSMLVMPCKIPCCLSKLILNKQLNINIFLLIMLNILPLRILNKKSNEEHFSLVH